MQDRQLEIRPSVPLPVPHMLLGRPRERPHRPGGPRHRQDLDEVLRRTLAVLVEEGEMATEEARRYQEELGIAVEPEE
jgi:hypothetical protein